MLIQQCITLDSGSTGNNANIQWRAIHMSHLRTHPLFRSLPEPYEVNVTSSLDLRLYRQDSWQWDALHAGRLTTSKVASCLGFYESAAAAVLRVPRSLQSHNRAISSWEELKIKPPQDWGFLMDERRSGKGTRVKSRSKVWLHVVPVGGDSSGDIKDNSRRTSVAASHPSISNDNESTSDAFPYRFAPEESSYNTVMGIHSLRGNCSTPNSARLRWGSAQEATAILAALNYFTVVEPGTIVAEAGMCPFESLQGNHEHLEFLRHNAVLSDIISGIHSSSIGNRTRYRSLSPSQNNSSRLYEAADQWIRMDRSLPLLGASPDGIIKHANGATEVLEVKCVSPFISNPSQTRASGNSSVFGVFNSTAMDGDSSHTMAVSCSHQHDRFAVWHIPQIQMEMFCMGAHCESGIILVLSVAAARMFRVQRDDEVCTCKSV